MATTAAQVLDCSPLAEALRGLLKEQEALVERVLHSPASPASSSAQREDLKNLGRECRRVSDAAREQVRRHKHAVAVMDATKGGSGGLPLSRALGDRITACDATIESLINETKSTLAAINVVSEEAKPPSQA
mmetsp:Transcript_4781/g.12146  ORF Transcript_4781/g.12146 Transcript_4781/m.12146 type:complete len:132 (+) Transcript_4781:44-439(+)